MKMYLGTPQQTPSTHRWFNMIKLYAFSEDYCFVWEKKYILEAKTIFMTKNFFYRGSYYDYEQLLFFL